MSANVPLDRQTRLKQGSLKVAPTDRAALLCLGPKVKTISHPGDPGRSRPKPLDPFSENRNPDSPPGPPGEGAQDQKSKGPEAPYLVGKGVQEPCKYR
jgi:hypothetical protein